jgi:hypothetical protein
VTSLHPYVTAVPTDILFLTFDGIYRFTSLVPVITTATYSSLHYPLLRLMASPPSVKVASPVVSAPSEIVGKQ